MREPTAPQNALLIVMVLVHLILSLVHGAAHVAADVRLSLSATLFVFLVILIGPVAGLGLRRSAFARAGTWVIAGSMGGALIFGIVNHFIVAGVDHVGNIAEPWRVLFTVTAALLAVTEAFGSGLAAWCAVRAGTSK
jgi:hypothetical protein